MRATRPAEQALRLATSRPTQQYVCTACRAQAARQFHTSSPRRADEPFYRRLQQTIFGSKESKDAEQSREAKQKRRVEELAISRNDDAALEVKTDKHGRQYEVAAMVDTTVNKDYVQSTTWAGLESVGSVDWVQQRADRGEKYVGFAAQKRMELSNAHWAMLLHHITVEALVLQKAGRDVGAVCWPRVDNASSWERTRGATILPSVDGGVTVTFTQAEAEREVLQAIPQALPVERTQNDETLFIQLQAALAEANTSKREDLSALLHVSLQDPTLKMAIHKRALQLTGKRLPDPALSRAATVADLYTAFRTKDKPKKLAQAPQLQRLNVEAPNVSVYLRRQTPIDKDIAVGRWKVIEEELVRRDLPVTGSRYQGARVGVQ
ncbi:hypothetical protein LTR36_008240 [Oleoguttula mirabilis]|uniref:Large ribosomal subunit protein mL50 n=1 Tax=Oleoguttula mirabilis TaxID=1507867 RepID=A0AAV9J8A1_9PEZI|nr:hypothetical protein LTR36_008240 [Oleoguttula mirabilis]